jgi:hypothetical protein
MGIVENADPHPSDTFEVTLRGEKAIQAWLDAEKGSHGKGKPFCRKTP